MFISNAIPGKITATPSLSFLLRHSQTEKKLVFDLGVRKDFENHTPYVIQLIRTVIPVEVTQDAVESLRKGGLEPADIDHVCLSHCHWDHVGDTHLFTKSKFIVGGACQSLFLNGYPTDPNNPFALDLPEGRTEFLDPSGWKPLGPFPRALDFYGDGSLYMVDAPGHLAGHMNVLARTSSDGGWIYLAGDSAHHRNLITLESDIAVGFMAPDGQQRCAHDDKEAAHEHILRVNKLLQIPRVQVLLAHDAPWYSKHKGGDSFWPGKIQSL